jgi:hypothetical protein
MDLLLKTKLKNMFEKEKGNLELEYHLKNIVVNGSKRGCSGFIVNKNNNKIVYITTESTCASWLHPFMYREAKSTKDYTGGRNNFTTKDKLIDEVLKMLS